MSSKEKRIYAQYMREVADALDRWSEEPEDNRYKTGHWILTNPGYIPSLYKCSVCNRISDHTMKQFANYCPYCGAKMDEVEE